MKKKQRRVFNGSDAKNLVYATNNFKINPVLPETKKKFNKLVKKINILKEDTLDTYYAILRPALVKILEYRELIKDKLGDYKLNKLNFISYKKIMTTNFYLRDFNSVEELENSVETSFRKISYNSPINLEEYNKFALEFNEKLKNIVLDKDSSEKLAGTFHKMNGLNNLMRRIYTEDIEVVDVISNKNPAKRKGNISKIEKILDYSRVKLGTTISDLTIEGFNERVVNFNLGIDGLSEKEIEDNKSDLQHGVFRLNGIRDLLIRKCKYPEEKLEKVKTLNIKINEL